jgi:hypothetical protein
MTTILEQVAQWAADNPEAAAALRAEGATSERQKFQGWQSPDQVTAAVAAARLDGAAAEAQRSAAVRAQVIPGHEALIEQLAADGITTGEQAAVRVLAAERERLAAAGDARLASNPPAVPFAAGSDRPAAKPITGVITSLQDEEAIDKAARHYQANNPGTSYAEALNAISRGI